MDFVLSTKPAEIWPQLQSSYFSQPTSIIEVFKDARIISTIIAFLLTWISTAILLHHYSRKVGRIKYWIIICIPLGYFLSQFADLFLNLFTPLLNSDPIFINIIFTLIFTLSLPIGGTLFGLAFWSVARTLGHDTLVRQYMIMSSYGIILFFLSGQATVIQAPFPPFGLVTVSFVGLSSFLMFIGLYSAAISVSEDIKLRQSIRKTTIEHSKLLDSIGTAEMEQELERRIMRIAKNHTDSLEEESGVEPSMTEDDIKEYMGEVLNEVKNLKKPDSIK